MKTFQTMLLFALLSLTIGTSIAELPKPSYARTMLKVSRSLPGETEELQVRTSEGNVATLIVKRREKSVPEGPQTNRSSADRNGSEETERERESMAGENLMTSESKKKEEVRKLEDAQIQQLRAKLSDPEVQRSPEKLVNSSENAKTGSVPMKEQRIVNEKVIDYGRWIPLGEDGRALRLEEPTREEYQNWKPLQADVKTTTEERTNYGRFIQPSYPSLVLFRNFQDRGQRNLEFTDRSDEKDIRYTFLPHQSRPARTNVGANASKNRDAKNVPPEVIVRSEINVKSSPKRSPMSLDRDGTPVIHGKRVPDEPIDKIQTWRNARVINNKLIRDEQNHHDETTTSFYPENAPEKQRFERFFKNINRRYGRNFDEEGRNVFFEWDPKNYKNEALKAEVYEARNDNYRSTLHKRMLHPDGFTTYPNSQMYTPESQKIAPVALKPGARAPVLQYAHPELGVQPAKIVKNEKRRPDNFPENQHSFTEPKQKKKYVLNDKNIIDTYTTKNYYPNQHFYGLKRPHDPPFWVKISENLKNQFSTGVEKMSQFTRPVIDPLVEATHKISQNLGLSKGKEAQDKVGTVVSGTSMLIPALGLVASGAALGIGAVAVGRYLDVDVLKRSNEDDIELEHKRALAGVPVFSRELEIDNEGKFMDGQSVYMLNVPEKIAGRSSEGQRNDVMLILEENQSTERKEDGSVSNSEKNYQEEKTERRRRRSLDYLDLFKVDRDLRSLIRSKRLQRKGADSFSEIVEIDLPGREGNIDVTEYLIPKSKESKEAENDKNAAILVVKDVSMSSSLLKKDFTEINNQVALDDVTKIVKDIVKEPGEAATGNSVNEESSRRRRSVDSDQELDDALQNLENAEIAEVAHIDADWTNTPCAKRIFCDTMIQRVPDAAIFMEKKMAALLGLIQPGAAAQVSSHFQEVMGAVRSHDCSRFTCPQARPGNVFL